MARQGLEGYYYSINSPLVSFSQYLDYRYSVTGRKQDEKEYRVIIRTFGSYVVYPQPHRETPKTLMGWKNFSVFNRKGIELGS